MKFTEKDILQTFKNFDLINNDNKGQIRLYIV